MKSSEGLYDRGKIIRYTEGDVSLERSHVEYYSSVTDIQHVVTYTDSLQSIAQQYYGSNFPWFILADINPNIEDIFQPPVGETILIPDLNLLFGGYA